jgi:ATP-dependent DNA ligase
MGTDVSRKPHQERTKLVDTMWADFGELLNELPWVEIVRHHSIDMLETMVGAASIGNKHYDGVVLVHKHSRYNDRPHLKLKNAVSVDYVLTAINLSESKYHEGTAATITAPLLIGGELVDVCKVGNLPNKLRSALTLNPADYIGKVFEATGNKAFESGALRHPVFLRWRDDKLPSGCTLAQVQSQRPDARCGAA